MAKIVILTQNLDTGGVQKSAAMLAEWLEHECIVVLCEDHKPIRYPLPTRVRIETIPTKPVDITLEGAGEEIFTYRVGMLEALMRRLAPDLIVSYEDYHNILSLSIECPAKRIVSCRISLHNLYTPDAKIHLMPSSFYFERIGALYPKAEAVVCVSRFVCDEIDKIAVGSRALTIYNGVDMERIGMAVEPLAPMSVPLIVHVGRLHPQKGQMDLIQAFARIVDRIPHRLVIIGEGMLYQPLLNEAKKLGIDHRVECLGNISEPYPYMHIADIVVIPSYQEGFSNTVLEAMVCKGGVIAARYDGHDEILRDYGNLFDPGDIDALGKIMERFLNDDALRAILKENQFRDVGVFELRASRERYRDLIEEVLRG